MIHTAPMHSLREQTTPLLTISCHGTFAGVLEAAA